MSRIATTGNKSSNTQLDVLLTVNKLHRQQIPITTSQAIVNKHPITKFGCGASLGSQITSRPHYITANHTSNNVKSFKKKLLSDVTINVQDS